MMIYDSGCKPSFANNYGTVFVSRGPSHNAAEGRFDISEGSFSDGMKKTDIPIYGNNVINGAFPELWGTIFFKL